MNALTAGLPPLLATAPEVQRVHLEPGGRWTADRAVLVEVSAGTVDWFLAPLSEAATAGAQPGPPRFVVAGGPGSLAYSADGGPALALIATDEAELLVADAVMGWAALRSTPSPRRLVSAGALADWAGALVAISGVQPGPDTDVIDRLLADGHAPAEFERLFLDAGCSARLEAERRMAASAARAEARSTSETATLDVAMKHLRRVLGASEAPTTTTIDKPVGGGLAGAAAVLDWLGISWDLPTQKVEADLMPASARLIARHGARWRDVLLAPGWWMEGGETLVAFRSALDGGGSVALLPRLGGGYTALDAPGARPRRLRAREARAMLPRALAVQAPLTGEGWTARALVTHGLRASHLPVGRFMAWLLLSGLLSLAMPVAMGLIMDPILPLAELPLLIVLVGVLLIAAMAGALLSLAQSLLLLRLEGLLDNRVQSAVWDRLMRLPAPFFRGFGVGDLVARANAVNEMRQLLTSATISSVIQSLAGLISLGLMAVYGRWLVAPVVLLTLVYVGISFLLGRRAVILARAAAALSGRQQSFVLQLVASINRIRLSGAQGRIFARWVKNQAALAEANLAQRRLLGAVQVLGRGVGPIALAMVLGVLALHAGTLFSLLDTPQGWADLQQSGLAQAVTVPGFVAFNAAMGQFIASVTGLAGSALSLSKIRPLYERVAPLMKAVEEEEAQAGQQDLPTPLRGAVEFAGIRFRYHAQGPTVLAGVSFRVRQGEFVAIVGPSGSGKSSLVRLLLGLETPEAGSVLVDGRDLALLPKRAFRRACGIVLQDGKILEGSIYENIAMGAALTEQEVWDAAHCAAIADDIRAMPMGLRTRLNMGGTLLSGGQRQRLLVARAIARRPALMIFDEATSALDNLVQARIAQALERMAVTRIVIAHRLSTIAGANRILVLDEGRIVEEGSHDVLMAANGLYATLARRQTA